MERGGENREALYSTFSSVKHIGALTLPAAGKLTLRVWDMYRTIRELFWALVLADSRDALETREMRTRSGT